ncbi:diacylglycerol kinase family lipid kinase [Nemorincola caseinilytica]|uniref:Diacylglycerol kinase family lipid kinase n=1 Tax=Nemorincola caseinilytica TaxID=2054315 RepID=A0ABP8NB47_9BACT
MSKRHIVFIVNPRSGIERQKEISHAIDAHLDSDLYTHEIRLTEYAKHGTLLAREAAAQGAYAVVAVGGDGSVNDVVHGLAGTDTVLGVIPKGSGNGMARTIGLPLTTDEAVKVISAGKTLAMDVGYANERIFISNAGVAFDALISKKFAKSEKRGLAVYSWLVTKHMWLYKTWNFHIEIDGKIMNERAFMVVVANGTQFGYNFRIAPMASYTDGLLDVIIVRRFPKILGGIIALRAMTGTIDKSRYVRHFTGREMTISHPQLRLMQTDGDAHECASSITFRIKPGAQRVIVP